MATGLVSWSTTAATNATADASVNFAEGQAPSSLNDSARALMASMAKWRDDNNGSLAVGGGTTNYTVTSNQVFATLAAMHRQTLTLLWPTTCAASPTLNVDGLGAKQIVVTVGTNVGAGGLVANAVYNFCYENNNAVWILCSPATFYFASGTALVFYQASAPTGWTKSATNNDKALRVVSGSGGVAGGTTAFTSVFASRTILQGHLPNYNLSLASVTVGITDPTHVHSMSGTINSVQTTGATGNSFVTSNVGGSTQAFVSLAAAAPAAASTGITASIGGTLPSGGSGTGIDFAVQYIDVIVCTKD